MGIGQIGNYGGLYGNYKAQNIKTVDMETVREQDARRLAEEEAGYGIAPVGQEPKEQSKVQSSGMQEFGNGTSENSQSRIANLQDISLTFNQSDDFGYIGHDASLAGLDMEKAISDMKKDQGLEQYNYFVGSTQNMITGSQDGTVIRKS